MEVQSKWSAIAADLPIQLKREQNNLSLFTTQIDGQKDPDYG